VGIKLDGPDTALLIGKEGYRYNALNYMLYSWINQKFGFKVRLEIAEFLKTQTEMLKNYLAPFIEKVRIRGYGKTKPFDGILAFLALEILRHEFPEKYVAIKEKNREKYIVIGERHEHYSGNSNS
jgi:spoIIIJ-associated protein